MSRLVVLLPPDTAEPVRWLTLSDDAIAARGEGDDWPRMIGTIEGAATPVTLLAPAAATTLHRALLPDLAPRQAMAAARLMAVENALGDPDTLHVAAGPRDPDGGLDVAVVANADMAAWLAWAAAQGLDAEAIIPAALLLPRPEEGFLRASIGGETIVRDKSAAFALDPSLAGLMLGGEAVTDVSGPEIEAALVAAVAAPPLDLRQGVFARRVRRGLDHAALRRAAVLAGLILAMALVISLVRIAKLDADRQRLDAQALAAARTVIPGTANVMQAELALGARAAALGVGGRSFANVSARLFAALDQSPAVALRRYDLGNDGVLRATLTAPTANDLDIALAALRASGAGTVSTPAPAADGRPSVQITVAPR